MAHRYRATARWRGSSRIAAEVGAGRTALAASLSTIGPASQTPGASTTAASAPRHRFLKGLYFASPLACLSQRYGGDVLLKPVQGRHHGYVAEIRSDCAGSCACPDDRCIGYGCLAGGKALVVGTGEDDAACAAGQGASGMGCGPLVAQPANRVSGLIERLFWR